MKRKTFLLLFAIALAVFSIPAATLAVEVKNPQNVEYMKTEITQSGSVLLAGDVSELNVSLYIPQSDSSQTVEIEEISNPDYFLEKDKYGNRKVNMFWKNPSSVVDFKVKTSVSTTRRNSGNFYNIGDFSKPTELIQSTDPDIKALAENLTIGRKTDFEKIATLTKWVNENIEYDLTYSDVNLSATTVLHHRKGVCDEFSTLLLSMVRSIGYQSSYVVGYAYGKGYTFSEGDFAAHGWTEIYTPSGSILSDPTWGEIPVDATHIRFASLADSIYPEVNASGFGKSPALKINPTKTDIKILEVRENPIIESKTSLLEANVWKGYVVAKTELSAPDCVLTKFSSQSCMLGGNPLLQPEQNDSVIYFCGSKALFSIFKSPDSLNENKIYTCPIAVSVYNANSNILNLTMRETPSGEVKLSIDRNIVEDGGKVLAQSPGSYIFTSDGQSGFGEAEFTVNDNITVYAYRNGSLERQAVGIIKERPFDVFIAANKTYFAGKAGLVNITIRNLLQKGQDVTLSFRNITNQINIGPLSENSLSINFTPASRDDNFLQVYASGNGFSSYASKLVEVEEIQKQKEWWENILDSVGNFFNSIADFFRKLFGAI